MKVMPTPVNDAAVALRVNQTKTEHALRKVVQNFSHTFYQSKLVLVTDNGVLPSSSMNMI